MEKLTGRDYLEIPLPKLVKYPDFSNLAMQVITTISEMTTEQLENLIFEEGNNG